MRNVAYFCNFLGLFLRAPFSESSDKFKMIIFDNNVQDKAHNSTITQTFR